MCICKNDRSFDVRFRRMYVTAPGFSTVGVKRSKDGCLALVLVLVGSDIYRLQ
jgi:hypothetical protein